MNTTKIRLLITKANSSKIIEILVDAKSEEISFQEKSFDYNYYILSKEKLLVILEEEAIENISSDKAKLIDEIIKGKVKMVGNIRIIMDLLQDS